MSRYYRVLTAIFFAAALSLLLPGVSRVSHAQEQEGRLMRFPAISKDKIVFSYAGDLWLVPSTGGTARRITTDPGLELFPKFSPDGKSIAFTAQYDGNFNVYVIPAEGGEPKQLTFLPDSVHMPERMGPNNEVITWMPDGKSIVFLSRRDYVQRLVRPALHRPRDGGLPVRLPIEKGGADVVLARWRRDRLQPHLPQLPHVEALHAAAWPQQICHSTISRPTTSRKSPIIRRRHVSDVARRHRSTSIPTAAPTAHESLGLRHKDQADARSLPTSPSST